MRVVGSAAEAADALESAQSEALKGFGRSECYVERYLTWPRHIEMQVFADTHGNAVWVGERDCSAQRRHQKLIEESPAPLFPDEVRQAMGEAAVRVTKGCGYVNAGTVEFLYQDGDFFFLEMNTRLQVEHPVTELVTGLDLVAEQIRVASGEPLSFTQDDIVRRGHAIEVRVNAEDPAGGKFLPSPGPITQLRVPQGFGVRWDGGYEGGDEVSQFYDNLVGKLIVWGSDRDVAIARTIRALDEFEITGIATTLPADLAILRHEDFRAGQHSTKWVEERLDLSATAGATPAAVAGMPGGNGESAEPEAKIRRDVDVEVNGRKFSVAVYIPESQVAATAEAAAGNRVATRRRRTGAAASGGAGTGDVTVPMQGTIVKVLVAQGDTVEVGQTVCVLEAMKMENNITAEKAGTITELRVEAGQSVGSGDVVAVIA
jgi:acetyl-CoA/propionyl-CoA carboxylase biotin carboxyl carrier protein